MIEGDTVAGLVIIGIACGAVAMYALCIKAMLRSEDLMQNTCYKFMVQLGIADMIQLVGLGLGGLMSVAQSTFHPWFNIIAGGIIETAFISTVAFCHLIAFNRFITTLAKPVTVHFFFGPKGWKVCSSIAWSTGLIIGGWNLMEKNFIYTLYSFSWYYDFSLPPTPSLIGVKWAGWLAVNVPLVLIITWYSLMLIGQRIMVGNVTNTNPNIVKAERVATLTAGMICSVLLIENLVFMYAPGLLPANRYWFLVLTFTWMCNAGINPVIYLSLNKTIRKRVGEMLKRKSSNGTSVAPVSTIRLSKMGNNTGNHRRSTQPTTTRQEPL